MRNEISIVRPQGKTRFVDRTELIATSQEIGTPRVQCLGFGAVAGFQRRKRNQIFLHATPAARSHACRIRRIEQLIAPLAFADDVIPEQSRLGICQQTCVMRVRALGARFQPLLAEPRRPRHDARGAPDGLSQALRMLGIAQPQRVREPTARGEHCYALIEKRMEPQCPVNS